MGVDLSSGWSDVADHVAADVDASNCPSAPECGSRIAGEAAVNFFFLTGLRGVTVRAKAFSLRVKFFRVPVVSSRPLIWSRTLSVPTN